MKVRAFPKTRLAPLAALVSMSLLVLSGCATKEFVQQEVGGVNGRIDTLQNLLKEANQRVDGNSVRLNYSEARLDKTEQTAADLGRRIDANLAGQASANQRLDGLSGELAAAGSGISANTVEIARAHQRLDASEEQAQASHRRLEGSVASLALTETRLGAAEAALHSLSGAATDAAAGAAAPGAAAQPEARAAAPVLAPVAPPATMLGDANSRLDSIAALVATANQRIAANSSAIDNVAVRLGGVESGLGETRKRTEDGEQALAAANLRIDEVHGQIGAAKDTVAAQAAAIGAVDKRVDGGGKDLTETATRLAQLQAAIADERDRLSRHEADAAAGSSAFKRTLEGLGTSLEDANKHVAAVDKSLVDSGERVDQLQTAVREQGSRLDQNESNLAQTGVQVGQAVAAIKDHEERLLANERADNATSATAKEALERAIAAGRLAEGKLVYETVLSEELANFDLDQAKLSEASKQVLTDFANKLRADNKNVFIEIQGHTDDTGPVARNQRLGRERAEAAHTFLRDSGGIPLHRMAVYSYGESRPVADNGTREGRMKNRRVVLVVLQ